MDKIEGIDGSLITTLASDSHKSPTARESGKVMGVHSQGQVCIHKKYQADADD